MLTMTDKARDVLRQVPRQPDMRPGSGLRIARPAGGASDCGFRTVLARQPRQQDLVVEHEGARVFLGPVAAQRFAGARLDARFDAAGRIEFVVRTDG